MTIEKRSRGVIKMGRGADRNLKMPKCEIFDLLDSRDFFTKFFNLVMISKFCTKILS
jgi:hypothetical protein